MSGQLNFINRSPRGLGFINSSTMGNWFQIKENFDLKRLEEEHGVVPLCSILTKLSSIHDLFPTSGSDYSILTNSLGLNQFAAEWLTELQRAYSSNHLIGRVLPLKLVKKLLQDWKKVMLTLPTKYSLDKNIYHRYGTVGTAGYSSINRPQRERFAEQAISDVTRLHTNTYTVLDISPSATMGFLYVLMIKPAHIEYFLLCTALGVEPHPSIFELWVDSKFDHVSFPNKTLRTTYRKNVKAPFQAAGITIKAVDDLDRSILINIELPEDVKSLSTLKAHLEDIRKEVFLADRVRQDIMDAGMSFVVA